MANVRIETWERVPFDDMTDLVEVQMSIFGNVVKIAFILTPDDVLLLKGFPEVNAE